MKNTAPRRCPRRKPPTEMGRIPFMLAQERLASADPKKLRSMDTVMEDLGITQEEIDAAEDVEIE